MDVAALNLNIDSSSVLKAANDLDTFSAAAKRAGSATGNPNGSMAKLVATVQSLDSKLGTIVGALDKIERGMGSMSKAAQAAAVSNDNMASSATKASRALAQSDSLVIAYTQHLAALTAQQRQANAHVTAWRDALASQASATQQSDAHILSYRNSLAKVEDGARKASTAIKFTAQDSLNASRQLADIGVTAAMGMSPFMIAIQQGPQLLDILQNKAAVTGQTLSAVFRAAAAEAGALLLALAPLIIAVVALAAGIAALTSQANDDSGLKKYTTAMGYTRAEVEKLNAVTVTWGDTMKAVFQVGWERIADSFGVSTDYLSKKWSDFTDWLVVAIRAGLAGVYSALTGAQNIIPRLIENIKTGRKESLFEVIGGSYADQYREAQKFMDDVVKQARNNARTRQDEMAKRFYDKPSAGAHQYDFGDLLKEAQKMENDLTKAQAQIGLYGEALARVTYEQELFNKASEHGLKLSPQETEQIRAKAAALAQMAEANRLAQFRQDTKQNILERLQAIKDEAAQIGLQGQALNALRIEQELLNRARGQNPIPITAKDREKIRASAEILAEREYQSVRQKSAADNARWHAEEMRQLDVERGAIGLTGKELIAYNYQQELINKALQAGVVYKDIDFEKTRRQAEAYATAKDAIDKQAQAIADSREVAKGFFTDTLNGLREGANAFSAFADAAVNALNRIIDKLLDRALDGFLNSLFPRSLTASGISAANTSVGNTIASNPSVFAKGGTFGTPTRFANGGAFTNSIVNTPTLFRFANGGALGEMGEAGPEAIMPLSRDSNGKLGVQMHGGGSKASVRMGDYNPTFQFAGAVGLDGIAQLVRQGGQETYDQMKRDLQTLLQQLDVDGTFAT